LVDRKRSAKVGFILVLADVESVGLAKKLPIDRADFVTVHVRTMLFEIDACADMFRAMDSTRYPFDNILSKELQGRDFCNVVWP
jgi:hypothetical protein